MKPGNREDAEAAPHSEVVDRPSRSIIRELSRSAAPAPKTPRFVIDAVLIIAIECDDDSAETQLY